MISALPTENRSATRWLLRPGLALSLNIEPSHRVRVHDEAALSAEHHKVLCIRQLPDRSQGSRYVRNLERLAELRRAVLRDRLQSLPAEVRDACSIRGVIGHTIQGSIRFHEGLRRHTGWSHIVFGSRVHCTCHGLPRETWRSRSPSPCHQCRSICHPGLYRLPW